jgi:hypothetical protein
MRMPCGQPFGLYSRDFSRSQLRLRTALECQLGPFHLRIQPLFRVLLGAGQDLCNLRFTVSPNEVRKISFLGRQQNAD